MKPELYNYDVFPKVILAGKENTITIKPLGIHAGINAGENYTLVITGLEEGDPALYPEWECRSDLPVQADTDGYIRFSYTFPREEEYFLLLFRGNPEDDKLVMKESVYALAEDMKGRYPFRGDLHVHSCRSDGKEDPVMVCANYRGFGYDFMIVSDHRRYYPSLDARKAYEGVAPSFNILPGEEVQLPLTDIHIINVGGDYSVNALIDGNMNQRDRGDDPSVRSVNGKCPPVISREEYERQIREIARADWFGAESANLSYAACVWAFDRIREAGGMGVFCHPYWRRKWAFQVPEKFLSVMLDNHPFDAFEVLGGERYFEHNGFQTVRYYEETAAGVNFPIVGSTDTHGSTEHNIGGFICSTIVFAPENTKDGLTSSIKDRYSVAVDTISKEFRLVGSLRLQKYACFLMNCYFPLHDKLCNIEGQYMRQYAAGEEKTKARLDLIADDVTELMKKYIAVE